MCVVCVNLFECVGLWGMSCVCVCVASFCCVCVGVLVDRVLCVFVCVVILCFAVCAA